MPKVTAMPCSASFTARSTAARNTPPSAITWSAGITTSTGSSPACRAHRAASVMAGAVLRPTGSSSTVPCLPSTRTCSATANRCSSLQINKGCAKPSRSSSRATVDCSIDRSSTSGSNCLGYFSRESGHRRVPEPPERTTGRTDGIMGSESRKQQQVSGRQASANTSNPNTPTADNPSCTDEHLWLPQPPRSATNETRYVGYLLPAA